MVMREPSSKRRIAIIAVATLLAPSWLAAQGPTPVSPGAQTTSTHVGSSCPTFSWSESDQAKGYELAVYEVGDRDTLKRRLKVTLPSGAGSWTPSAADCLSSGRQYGWAVRAVTRDGSSSWSPVALFATAGAPTEDEVRYALEVLQRHEDASVARAGGEPGVPGANFESGDDDEDDLASSAAAADGAAAQDVAEMDGAGLGSPPRVARVMQHLGLTIDGDLDLSGRLLKGGALFLYSDSSNNTALGEGALIENLGKNNVAVGKTALRHNTLGERNTAVGEQALNDNTEGSRNTALGENTLLRSTEGNDNTAVGQDALFHNTVGNLNTAVGKAALWGNLGGDSNTAVGYFALHDNTGNFNVAVGETALENNKSGAFNTAVGYEAGRNWTDGGHNIAIGVCSNGKVGDSFTTRIGGGLCQTRAFIAGIRGRTTGHSNAIPVLIDSSGQLGTVSSSARYKEDIADLGSRSSALMELRPVEFRYKQAFDDGEKPLQYGLIAEEVARVLPELVVYDAEGKPETVKYHWLSTLLVNEIQRQGAEVAALRKAVAGLGRSQVLPIGATRCD